MQRSRPPAAAWYPVHSRVERLVVLVDVHEHLGIVMWRGSRVRIEGEEYNVSVLDSAIR